jgi:uncharacterized protein (TIGR03437 family)
MPGALLMCAILPAASRRRKGLFCMKKSSLSGAACVALFAVSAYAQQPRIAAPVNNLERMTLHGHIHPNARADFDQGRAAPSLEMDSMTLTIPPSPAQQTELDQLLKAQQAPGSSSYHQWLRPEEFAERFGASPSDIQAISAWLQSEGFTVSAVARGRNSIAFSGTAGQVESAFQTEVHNYLVNGTVSYANATDPTIPGAFNGVVTGIRGLHNFRMRAHSRALAKPNYTSANGVHQITPGDFAVIYDVAPLYAAGIDGTGQSMAVAGQTVVNLSDIETFRSTYGLPANNPTLMLVPTSRSPGISKDDLPEADLDLELSGAVARNATIFYVYATDVMVGVQYAIDQDLAKVVSVSYGSCEQETANSDIAAFRTWAQQGNAQGITWFAASGDDGAADCADSQNPGYAVDTPGSVPEVTSVGGTQLMEGIGNYWNATNTSNGTSALSYIPEATWNTSVEDDEPSASGGGASIVFGKPSWQTGSGVPNDNARDVPDVSLAASPDHDGFFIYTGGSLQIFGGTSVAAPSFAGITVLLNQYQISKGIQSSPGQGNINPNLYSLAQTNPAAFHDVTTGNNIVTIPCSRRLLNCTPTPVGYYAGAGYDQTTGLGSVDAYNLITGWSGEVSTPTGGSAVITLLANLRTIAPSEVTYLTATVTSADGSTPTGSITFEANGTSLGSAALTGVGAMATATLAVNGGELPLGSATLTALYSGSSNVTASVAMNVTASGSGGGAPAVTALVNPASYKTAVAPGGILTVFGSQLAPAGSSPASAASLPLPVSLNGVAVLINGVAAPLYYASTGLLNVEIPYQTQPGPATLSINNNGSVTTQGLTVSATAPAIFTSTSGAIVPSATASRGQVAFLYITGAGTVSPVVSTGSAPSSSTPLADLPAPTQAATVTVGGAPATIQFIGITPGLAGVMQINFEVPTSIGTGSQQVIVSLGGVSSPAATLTISN